jgi:hypothetical protein
MQWSYKTVQYELKKEGLLRNSFLDEMEVEQSLNEYGQEGWELVSLYAMQDGLMAVFKKPKNYRQTLITGHEPTIESGGAPAQKITEQRQVIMSSDEMPVVETAHERDSSRREPAVSLDDEQEDKPEEGGFGGIRIE